MRAKHSVGFLLLLVGAVFLHACESSVTNQEIGESFELITGLEQITEATNVTATINRGENVGANSWFEVNLDNIQSNEFIANGIVEGWCLEWKKPLNADNDVHKGTKIYATKNSDTWKPLNYLFAIKKDLEIEDPSLTRREFQAVIWTLAGDMGIAPKFDVTKLTVDELPNRLVSGNQPNFSREKVVSIVSRVQKEYRTAKFRLINTNLGGHVLQTDDDQQDVYIPPVEDPGKDVVVFNDINPFDEGGMQDPNNVILVENLVQYTTDGERNDGTVVWMDRGRNSRCAPITGNSECSDAGWATMRQTISDTGMNLVDNDTNQGELVNIPDDVKVIFLVTPRISFTVDEINALKQFADEGGRVVYIGEHQSYYGVGIDVENQFLINMGAVLRNTGQSLECGRRTLPGTSIIAHPITNNMSQFSYACFSNIEPGPEDFILMLGQDTDLNMAGVAEIDVTPISTLTKVRDTGLDIRTNYETNNTQKVYSWGFE